MQPKPPRHAPSKRPRNFPMYQREGSLQMQKPLGVIVDDIRDTHCRHHLQQIGRDPLEQAPPSLAPHRLHAHIHDPRVRRRVDRRALAL